jgi:hypothetical protein
VIGEVTDPRSNAAFAARAGLFQDLVLAITRLLDGNKKLTADDRKLLSHCERELAGSSTHRAAQPRDRLEQLAAGSEALTFLRAVPPEETNPTRYFAELAAGLRRALRRDRSERTLEIVRALRDLVLIAAEIELAADIGSDQEHAASRSWKPLTVSSIS